MNIMLFLTETCPNDFEILRIIYFVKIVLKIVFIAVPIGLILMIGLDFFKNVTASKEDEMKKNLNIAIKRIIYCVCIFFVPTIVNLAISLLGNLGVNYALYLDCANPDDIDTAINNKAYELVVMASDSLDYNQYSEAYDVVSKMKDGDLKTQYESRLQEVKTAIENEWESLKEDIEPITPTEPINNFDEDTINLFAAGIGMETGGYPGGFACQLITGAVMVNNMYTTYSRREGKPIKSSSNNITYDDLKNMFSYCPVYCNSGGSKMDYINQKGGGLGYLKSTGATDKMINQLQVVAKILLSKEFTIPQDVLGQGMEADWAGMNYSVWGYANTGVSGYNVTFAVINNTGMDGTKDVYGNTVSRNFNDYLKISDDLFKKYIK